MIPIGQVYFALRSGLIAFIVMMFLRLGLAYMLDFAGFGMNIIAEILTSIVFYGLSFLIVTFLIKKVHYTLIGIIIAETFRMLFLGGIL